MGGTCLSNSAMSLAPARAVLSEGDVIGVQPLSWERRKSLLRARCSADGAHVPSQPPIHGVFKFANEKTEAGEGEDLSKVTR